MDYTELVEAVRDHAAELTAFDPQRSFDCDSADLIRALARILKDQPVERVHRAFGAPGHWGYSTPIGKALATTYRRAS